MPRARYRRVRTPEGAERYGVPIGSIIRVNPQTGELHRGKGTVSRRERARSVTADEDRAAKKPDTEPEPADDEDDGTDDIDPAPTVDEIMDLLGGALRLDLDTSAPTSTPEPDRESWKDRYRSMLEDTSDRSDEATAVLPTSLVDRYAEYDREETGGEELDILTEIIERDGIRSPLRLSTDGRTAILHEGNHRLAAAKRLGIEEVPVHITLDEKVRANDGTPVPVDDELMNVLREHEGELTDFHGSSPKVSLPPGPPKGTVPDPAEIRSASNGERGDEEVRAALAENIAGRYDTGIEVRVTRVQLERNDFDEVESVWANLDMHDDTGEKVAHTSLNFRVDDEGMALTGGPQGGMDNYFFMNLENPRQEFDVQDTIGQIVQATGEWPEPAPDRRPIGETDVPDYLGSPSDESELYRERRAAIDAGDADEVAEIEGIIRDLDAASGERFRAELVYENQRSLERALKRKDIDADEAIEMARDGLAQFLEGRQVAVNVPSRNFGAILDSGRLLSQRDDGALTGVGTHAPDDRARIETAWFGEHEHPPIYGYIRDPGGAPSGADTYGRIALILNDDVRNRRTSVNVGDSLAGSESIFPGPLNDPGEFSGNPALAVRLGHRTPEDYAAWLAEGTDNDDDEGFYQRVYVEAQIHSGLSLSEVQEVVFRDYADADRYGPRLRELDIPFKVVPDRESPDAPAFSEDELAALRAFGASVPEGMTRAEYERLRAEFEAE